MIPLFYITKVYTITEYSKYFFQLSNNRWAMPIANILRSIRGFTMTYFNTETREYY
jgi:hypothetical protein